MGDHARQFEGPTGTGLVVFTRDLRISDHPALAAAVAEHRIVVPTFVFDESILSGPQNSPNRIGFLLECLGDLDASLVALGAALVIRRGDWVTEVLRLATTSGAETIHVCDDVSGFARARLERLGHRASGIGVTVRRHPGVTIVPPGALVPTGGDHYRVFTPYYRQWIRAPWRSLVPTPSRIVSPPTVPAGTWPTLGDLTNGSRSSEVVRGGETVARTRLATWVQGELPRYADNQNQLAADTTSRLSPYLRFGCLSPLDVAMTVDGSPGSEAFVRQLCWRDFNYQILAARPDAAWADYRPRGDSWESDVAALGAWRQGRTGYPVVDAAMRQLRHEGFMHNRARMIVASFLTKDLYIDWREGARHFLELLLDGDLANNNLNWQWSAGTGVDANPHRVFNPTIQGRRFDPDGEYVRRYVPELASIPDGAIHDPDPAVRVELGYPPPIIDHAEAIQRYRGRLRSRRTVGMKEKVVGSTRPRRTQAHGSRRLPD